MPDVDLDLESQESIDDPVGYFDRYRRTGPVHWSDAHGAWIVIGHAQVAEAFRDSELLSADRIGPLERVAEARPASFARVVELLRGWMVFHDPPQHTRLRAPVRLCFMEVLLPMST